jgi:hypothetical protein
MRQSFRFCRILLTSGRSITRSPCPIRHAINWCSVARSSAQRRHASAQWVRAGQCACQVRAHYEAALIDVDYCA